MYRGLLRSGFVPWIMQCRSLKVCVLGAMGSVGQPLSLLMKQSPWFEEAALYDKEDCKGLALELNQIDRPCKVSSYEGSAGIKAALKGAQVVINTEGSAGKIGMNKEDIFAQNVKTIFELSKHCAKVCPQALHVILTEPINSTVPIACEVYKKMNGCVDSGRIFGLTTIDSLRASTLVADIAHTSPETVRVPVVGGHSSTTMVPLLSRAEPCLKLSTDETVRITRALQVAGDEVTKTKEGPPVLSVAHAAAKMAESLAKGILGRKGIVECAYVMSNLIPDLTYFASPLELGPTGVQKILPLPTPLSNYECCLLESAIDFLKEDIAKGVKIVQSK